MNDDVRPEIERVLEVRRGEGVVDDELCADRVCRVGDRCDIDDVQERVGGRLDPDDRVRSSRCAAALVDSSSGGIHENEYPLGS